MTKSRSSHTDSRPQNISRDYDDLREEPLKASRVAAACDECRNKKIKCDGVRPICSACSRSRMPSATCTWGIRKARGAGVSQAEFNRLKRRIEELENGQATAECRSTRSAEEANCTSFSPRVLDDRRDNSIESMTMMGLMDDEHQSPSRVYADSSAKTFINRIKTVIDMQSSPPAPQPSRPEASICRPPRSRRATTGGRTIQDHVLPSRQRADYLLSSYWRLSVYPLLDVDHVQSQYARLWTGEDLGDDADTFPCLINMIFSMASIMDAETLPKDRAKNADVFYQRGREFLDLDFLQKRSLQAVQCFLLLGEYLQSANDPQGCWMFVGLAIRIAQSLGLDLASTSTDAPSVREREILRRVWHMCVLMDRSLAMAYGRPTMITTQAAASVPYPSAHADGCPCNCFTEDGASGPIGPSCHFFIEALKLYDVMNEISLALYTPTLEEKSAHDAFVVYFGNLGAKAVGSIMEMDTKLWSLASKMPLYLQYVPGADLSSKRQRQTNILWLRQRHIRLLLFRPVLARFCEARHAHVGKDLPSKVALQCAVTCVETALETINFLENTITGKNLGQLDGILPGWWYSILYIYTAAAVLVAARLNPAITSEVSEQAILDGWNSVMKILKRFANLSRHAARCAATLDLLFDQVPNFHLDRQQLPSQCQSQHHTASDYPSRQGHDSSRHPDMSSEFSRYLVGEFEHHPGPVGNSVAVEPKELPTAEATDGQDLTFNDSYFHTNDYGGTASDWYSSADMSALSDIHIDLDSISWLTTFPSQLLGNSPA